MEDIKRNTKVEFKITKWHVLTSLLIVALRAFQPNAEPMSEWSVFSWFLMTIPFMFGVYVFLLIWIVKIIVEMMIILLDNSKRN